MNSEKELKRLFQKANENITICEQEKYETLELLAGQLEKQKADSLYPVYPGGALRILFQQIRYVEKRAWAADLMVNIGFAAALAVLGYLGAEVEDAVAFLMLASSVMGSSSILVLSHLFAGGMGELSCTCYFSARQLAAYQMLALGAVNLLTLVFLICFAGIRWEADLFQIGIYMGVPFVLTVSVCIGVLRFEGLRNRAYPVPAAGILSAAGVLVLASAQQIYTVSAVAVWGAALAAGAAVLFAQIRHLFQEIDKGEILCTD